VAEIPDTQGANGIALGEVSLAVAWNVRGDPANAAFALQAGRALGLPLPVEAMTSSRDEGAALLWLGPRSWLYVAGDSSQPGDFDAARRAINAAGGALFDVSSSYVAWRVTGVTAARALNRACPLDLHPRTFPSGGCVQSMLGHINALFHKPDDASFIVMVARSFADDAWHTLCEAASTDGYRIAGARTFAYATRST
jgi:sarcosine oxidase subunit gamma